MITEAIDPSATRNGDTPTRRQESVALARITAPLAAAFIAEMAMSVTDTVIVGYLGSVQLGRCGDHRRPAWTLLQPRRAAR